MPNPRMKHRRVVHKSTTGILEPIPEAVDPVGNPPRLTTNTVAPLQHIWTQPSKYLSEYLSWESGSGHIYSASTMGVRVKRPSLDE